VQKDFSGSTTIVNSRNRTSCCSQNYRTWLNYKHKLSNFLVWRLKAISVNTSKKILKTLSEAYDRHYNSSRYWVKS